MACPAGVQRSSSRGEQRRRRHPVGEEHRAAFPVLLGDLFRAAAEEPRIPRADVAVPVLAVVVGHRGDRDRGLEALIQDREPAGHVAAVAAAGDADSVPDRRPALDQGVDAREMSRRPRRPCRRSRPRGTRGPGPSSLAGWASTPRTPGKRATREMAGGTTPDTTRPGRRGSAGSGGGTIAGRSEEEAVDLEPIGRRPRDPFRPAHHAPGVIVPLVAERGQRPVDTSLDDGDLQRPIETLPDEDEPVRRRPPRRTAPTPRPLDPSTKPRSVHPSPGRCGRTRCLPDGGSRRRGDRPAASRAR